MAFNPFRSARLIYRAPEDNEADNAFIHSIQTDHEALSGNTVHLLTPQRSDQSKGLAKLLRENALLGVIICLPPTPATTEGEEANEDNEKEVAPKPIGFICLTKGHEKAAHNRNAGIALSIHKDFRGRGYGSEAIRWTLGYAFVMANMHSVSIESVGWNEGAIRLYRKLGFVLEGRRREYLFYRGKWFDFVEMGMLDREWREMQKAEGKNWAEDPTA